MYDFSWPLTPSVRRPRSEREGFVLFKLPCPLPLPRGYPSQQPAPLDRRGARPAPLLGGWGGGRHLASPLAPGPWARGRWDDGRQRDPSPGAGTQPPLPPARGSRGGGGRRPCTCPRPAHRKTRLVFCRQRWEAVTSPCFGCLLGAAPRPRATIQKRLHSPVCPRELACRSGALLV